MAEQIKRGLTIHSPTMKAGPVIDEVVDDIMQNIEQECSMTIYESDEAATNDLRKNLEEKIKAGIYFPRLVFDINQALFNPWTSLDGRLLEIINAVNTYRAWLAIQAKSVESFDAKAGKE